MPRKMMTPDCGPVEVKEVTYTGNDYDGNSFYRILFEARDFPTETFETSEWDSFEDYDEANPVRPYLCISVTEVDEEYEDTFRVERQCYVVKLDNLDDGDYLFDVEHSRYWMSETASKCCRIHEDECAAFFNVFGRYRHSYVEELDELVEAIDGLQLTLYNPIPLVKNHVWPEKVINKIREKRQLVVDDC